MVRATSDSDERGGAAHDRMTALVLRGAGVEDVAAVVTEVLGGALLVLDAEGRRQALVGELDQPDPSAIAEALAASRTEGRSVRRGPLWFAAVVAGAENLGALVLRPDRPLVDADQRILERAAVVTALLQLFRRTVAEAEGRVRGGPGAPPPPPEGTAPPSPDAARCATALPALGRPGTGASTAELGFVGLLLGSAPEGRDRDVQSSLGSAIGPVVDYDARRGT